MKDVKTQWATHYLGWNEADPRPREMWGFKVANTPPYMLEMCRCICHQHGQAREKLAQSTTCLGTGGLQSAMLCKRDSGWDQGGNKPGNPTPYRRRKCWSGSSLPCSREHGVTEQSNESQQQGLSLLLSPEKTGYISGRWFLRWTCCFTQKPACASWKKCTLSTSSSPACM